MKRKYLFALILLIPSAQADLSADISKNCGSSEPVISISDPKSEYSHPGDLEMYDNKLCISGIEDSKITDNECSRSAGFYLSNRNDTAHFSAYESYNLNVCTGQMKTRVTSKLGTCKNNETKLFSVSDKENGHLADTDVFDKIVCGSYVKPENVSIELSFNLTDSDKVYFSGERLEKEGDFQDEEYNYLISEGDKLISGIVKKDIISARREIKSKNSLMIKSSSKDASFYIPFTEGKVSDIKSRETIIVEEEFLDQIQPSFGFFMPSEPNIKVTYNPETVLISEDKAFSKTSSLDIIKRAENKIELKR